MLTGTAIRLVVQTKTKHVPDWKKRKQSNLQKLISIRMSLYLRQTKRQSTNDR